MNEMDCGDTMLTQPPAQDVERARQHGLTFDVMHRHERGMQWLLAQAELTSIHNALDVARRCASPYTYISTSTGFHYWDSETPDLFNSSVLKRVLRHTACDESGFQHLVWRIYPSAPSLDVLHEHLKQLELLTGQPLEILLCEPYYKMSGRFHVRFRTALGLHSVEQAHAHVLDLCQQLGEPWTHHVSQHEADDGQVVSVMSYELFSSARWEWLSDFITIECSNMRNQSS